jgi:predicted glycosyltransferase
LLVANDGLSAGHVARMIAIAGGLARAAAGRRLALRTVIATTSQAHGLLASAPAALITVPSPSVGRRGGLSDPERRRLVRATIDGAIDGFAPDLLVIDTFPSGPHGELEGLRCRARRALIRRSVPAAAATRDGELTAGLAAYDLAILAGDPAPITAVLPVPIIQVPPITLAEAGDGLDRAAARAQLGLPADGRAVLVAAGGGGDADAVQRAAAIGAAIARVAPGATPVLAVGPLAARPAAIDGRVRVIDLAPLAPVLAAFDGAFAPAGYNLAHELAKAGVPAALFARPRPFDDQAARAARFAAAGYACALAGERDDDAAIAAALAWMATARLPAMPAGGADRAADALIELVTGGATGRATGGAARSPRTIA